MIEIADITHKLPIEVAFDAEDRRVLCAWIVVPGQPKVDISSLLSEDDWDHVVYMLSDCGYIHHTSVEAFMTPAQEGW